MLLLILMIILGTTGLVWFGVSHEAYTFNEMIIVFEESYKSQTETMAIFLFLVIVVVPAAFSLFYNFKKNRRETETQETN